MEKNVVLLPRNDYVSYSPEEHETNAREYIREVLLRNSDDFIYVPIDQDMVLLGVNSTFDILKLENFYIDKDGKETHLLEIIEKRKVVYVSSYEPCCNFNTNMEIYDILCVDHVGELVLLGNLNYVVDTDWNIEPKQEITLKC